MNNVVEFKLRKFEVLFMMPMCKIVKFRKTHQDDIELKISGNTGTAYVNATTKHAAERCLYKVLPDSKIISTVCLKE